MLVRAWVIVWLSVCSMATAQASPLSFVPLEQAQKQARKEGRFVFAHFTASWCKPCQVLKRDVYTQPAVAKRLANYVLAEVDTEKEPGSRIWLTLKEDSLPVMAVYDATGVEVRELRIRGSKSASELTSLLDDALELEMQRRTATPSEERAAARGREASERTHRPKVRGGQWQTTDTSWLETAVFIMLGTLAALVGLFIALKMRRTRR